MIYSFADPELDTRSFELRRGGGGEIVAVEPQVFEVLRLLVEHADRVVSKEELLDAVWRTRFVTESALTSRIEDARKAVGDDGRAQVVIRTIHGRGYRFVAGVVARPESPDPAAVAVPAEGLSPRELEVLAAIERRLTNAEIARELFISVRTVESHIVSLRRKLGVDSRPGLIAVAQGRSGSPRRTGPRAGTSPLGPPTSSSSDSLADRSGRRSRVGRSRAIREVGVADDYVRPAWRSQGSNTSIWTRCGAPSALGHTPVALTTHAATG
ncbi:MAG: winged helix-turn-helix domain-containing protein [Acidimicrobiales bacterium]